MASPRRLPPSPSPPLPPPPNLLLLEAEVTVVSAKHLKNVNWRHGDLKPYAVLYLDPDRRVATRADDSGSTHPTWNERFALPVDCPLDDALLTLEIFHSKPSETPKPLVGTARAPLWDLVDHLAGAPSSSGGSLPIRTLELRRPSGRPQGKVRIKVSVRDVAPRVPPVRSTLPSDYHVPLPSSYYYSSAPPTPPRFPRPAVRDYRSYPPPPPSHVNNLPPPSTTSQYSCNSFSDPYSGYYSPGHYSAPSAPVPSRPYYDRPSGYGGPIGPSARVDYSSGVLSHHRKPMNDNRGLGPGLAVGAVAGSLGGLTLETGVKCEKEKIAERLERGLDVRNDYND